MTSFPRKTFDNRERGDGGTVKRVLTYGTFDLLHHGHIRILSRAKAMGDYLVVLPWSTCAMMAMFLTSF